MRCKKGEVRPWVYTVFGTEVRFFLWSRDPIPSRVSVRFGTSVTTICTGLRGVNFQTNRTETVWCLWCTTLASLCVSLRVPWDRQCRGRHKGRFCNLYTYSSESLLGSGQYRLMLKYCQGFGLSGSCRKGLKNGVSWELDNIYKQQSSVIQGHTNQFVILSWVCQR